MRSYRKNEPNILQRIFSNSIFWLFLGIVALVLIAIPLYGNWQQKKVIDIEIDEIKAEIAKYESSNKELDEMIKYLNSEESLEAKARTNLGLKKPGEQVVVIKTEDSIIGPKVKNQENNNEEVSNPGRWLRYFIK
ncbi:MAG: septum formation initiator family protein [Candidatus Pacebacteria bacterium]|nr:septum formation initiator family protein [Candidatus Paceibacterota bacterium]